MPNRILRDWTDSKTMSELNWQEEVVFTRLIMKADDYGNFYRDAVLVKNNLFPRKDDVRSSDVDRWLKGIEAADLVRVYQAKGDVFLHIVNFGQRLRNTTRRFPAEPADIDSSLRQVAASCGEARPETKRNEVETEVETETKGATAFGHLIESSLDVSLNEKKEEQKEKGSAQKEKVNLPWPDPEFSLAWDKWKEYKKTEHGFKFKSPVSEEGALDKLRSLSGNDFNKAITIIDNSISNGWEGLFPLKNENNQRPKNTLAGSVKKPSSLGFGKL